MGIQGAIFDLDGTLLDSMGIWLNVGERYLRSKGVTPPPNVHEAIATFNMPQVADYFQTEFGLTETEPEIIAGIEDLLADFYAHEAEPLPGVRDLLDGMEERSIPCCIATTTDRHLVESTLRKNDLMDRFQFILTCSELHTDKEHPEIFLESCKRLGTPFDDTWVFEDAIHAIQTAKGAGFHVCAIEEASMEPCRDRIRELADIYLQSPADWQW